MDSVIRQCIVCETDYVPVMPQQRYCSRACYGKRGRQSYATQRARIERGAERRPCAGCGASFAYHPKLRVTYCSNACRGKATARERAIGRSCVVPWQQCIQCGDSFVRSTPGLCSDVCRKANFRRHHLVRAIRDRIVVTFKCRECTATVTPDYGDKRRVYCSDECHDRYARRVAKSHGLTRLRRRSAERIKRMRPMLLARSGGRCGICGLVIDLSLKSPHPLSLTIDHIHPLSAGGSDDLANLWPAHRLCNEEKGDDLGYRIGGLHLAS